MTPSAKAARRIINGGGQATDEADKDTCAVCGGRSSQVIKLGQVVSDNFTTWDLVSGDRSSPCCSACETIFRRFQYRSTSLRIDRAGAEKLTPEALRGVLSAAAIDDCVLTWPASRKKHCWLHAGVSTTVTLNIGCDDRTVTIDRKHAAASLDTIMQLIAWGATKTEIRTGMYRPVVVQRGGHQIEPMDQQLAPLRYGGALDILTWAAEREAGTGSGEMTMLDDHDRKAAHLIALLANGSAHRAEDPVGFWGRGLLSRLQRRLTSRDLRALMEAMAGEITVRTPDLRAVVAWIEALPEGDEAILLARIQRSPRVLVAVAQDIAKSMRGGNSRDSEQPSPRKAAAPEFDDPILI